MANTEENHYDVIVIGAGLTGLTTAFQLARAGKRVAIVERENRVGGQIRTRREKEFVFETGPNTGVLNNSEIIELFHQIEACEAEIACRKSKRRLIFKKGRLHALPSDPVSGLLTSLFTWKDKFGILLEPLRRKGNNPDESVAGITERRLGRSFLDYAVDPFISGIYAGDPEKLVTRHALPKLYLLEQQFGSFIKGAVKKAKEPKSPKEKEVTKEVFSVYGGLEQWIQRIHELLVTRFSAHVSIFRECQNTTIRRNAEGKAWSVEFLKDDSPQKLTAKIVIPTIAGYEYGALLPFVSDEWLQPIVRLEYAGVIQVSIGIKELKGVDLSAFGALVPTKEKREVLGILFLSSCFKDRAPQEGALLSIFIGGTKRKELLTLSDNEVEALVRRELHGVLGIAEDHPIDLLAIHRHPQAIPQYTADSDSRNYAIQQIENTYEGLILGGNIHGGIGMSDRVRQAFGLARRAIDQLG